MTNPLCFSSEIPTVDVALPLDAEKVSADTLAQGDGVWIDNGGCVGVGRIDSIVVSEKPTGFKVYDLSIQSPDGQSVSRRVTQIHRGLYRSAAVARSANRE